MDPRFVAEAISENIFDEFPPEGNVMNFATVMGGSTVGTTMGNPIVKTLALCFCRDGKADKLASSKR